MSGSLKMRPCLPKTIPRTNLRSYSVSALKSFAVILRPRKSKLSQVLMLAYSSCAKTDEDALSSASRKSMARKRQDVTGDFIFTFRLERRPKEPYFAGRQALRCRIEQAASLTQRYRELYPTASCLPGLLFRLAPAARATCAALV